MRLARPLLIAALSTAAVAAQPPARVAPVDTRVAGAAGPAARPAPRPTGETAVTGSWAKRDQAIDAAIAEAAARFALPADWIRAVIRAESAGVAFDVAGRPLVSRAGAIGLMQLMPGTYAAMARAHNLGPDPGVPRDNILAGTAFLRLMYDRFGSPGFLAAYNAGPGRWADHVATGTPLPRETLAYLASVGGRLGLAGIERVGRMDPAAPAAGGREKEEPWRPVDMLFVGSRSRSTSGGAALFFALQGSSGVAPRTSASDARPPAAASGPIGQNTAGE